MGASSAGIQAAPSVHAAASGGRPGAGRVPNARTTAVFVGCLAPGAASWNRPVSIGLTTIESRREVDEQELAAPGDAHDALPHERVELCRRAPDREGRERLRVRDRPTGHGRMEGLRDDRQVGQLGHGR